MSTRHENNSPRRLRSPAGGSAGTAGSRIPPPRAGGAGPGGGRCRRRSPGRGRPGSVPAGAAAKVTTTAGQARHGAGSCLGTYLAPRGKPCWGRAGQGLATCAPAGWKDSVGSRRRRRRREELLPPDAAAAPLCRIHPPAGCPGTAVPRRPFPGPLWPPRPPGGGARSPRPRPRQAGQLPPGRQHRGPGRLRSRWGRGQTEGGR